MMIENLRKLTQEAIERGKEQAKKERRERERAERKAAEVIGKIPDLAEKAARKGLSRVDVMNIDYSGVVRHKDELGLDDLTDAVARMVYKHCADAGFSVRIIYWHDSQGCQSGYRLVVKW